MAACWSTPKKISILVCTVALTDFFADYKQTRNWAPRGVWPGIKRVFENKRNKKNFNVDVDSSSEIARQFIFAIQTLLVIYR